MRDNWISLENENELPPPYGVDFLYRDSRGNYDIACVSKENPFGTMSRFVRDWGITHWQPIQAPEVK